MNSSIVRALPLLLAFGGRIGAVSPPSGPRVVVVSGSRSDGRATPKWLAMVRSRLSPAEYDSVSSLRHTRTVQERAWARLIESESAVWPARTAVVRAAFDPIHIDTVLIVVGDRGADDGFATDSATIGFDASALQRAYGDASAAGNADRLNRIFLHEFSHLLQKRSPAAHRFLGRSPVEEAIRREWVEGLGNYFSLSADWLPAGRVESDLAKRTLARLEPIYVARMAALACVATTDTATLMHGLSSGAFANKWGALPVALWLADETHANPDALRQFNRDGPDAVWGLAERHLPAALADSLRRARSRSTSCRPA